MARPKKSKDNMWYRPYFENAVILIVFFGATVASLSIDANYGTMMIIPGTLLLNRIGILHNIFSITAFLAGLIYLYQFCLEAFFIMIVHSLFYGLVTWAIFVALTVSSTVALAVVAALSACLVKIYKLDPEPILLLLLHTAISASMLSDPMTTFALITIVVAAITVYGDYDLPKERVVVFVMALATTAILGRATAIITSVGIGVVIVVSKLRPLNPPALTLLALGCLALILPVNCTIGTLVIFLYISVLTALFIFNKIRKSKDLEPPDPPAVQKHKTHHVNGYLPLSSPLESLDLHGHTVTGAMKVLHEFLAEREDEYRENRAQHIRHVTIITGSGNFSDPHDSSNLVKPTVVNFLKINKYKYEVPSDTPGLIKVDLESHTL